MTQTATVPPPSANGHDSRGRFAEGNRGGPGNPFARKTAALRRAMLDAVSDQDMQEVTAAVLSKAKGGDLAAAKLLYQYTVGRPRPAQDPDGLDAHEMHTYFQRIVPMALATELMQGFPLDVLLTILPHVLQARAETVSQQVTDGIPQAQEQHQKEQEKKARREERKRKYLEEREQRRAERRRQREAAPEPNPPGPPSLKGRGEEDTGGFSPPFPSGKGGGGVRSEPPSANGGIGPLTQEQWEAIMRQLLDGNDPPSPDGGT